ncbi:MAG: class I SAM-dependent methyltransferase [Thauera sp.]|jgi:O-antigen chain-terminating methyltransferase|nr:class I SAM-dependent methyltransferase [Thauera sp.]
MHTDPAQPDPGADFDAAQAHFLALINAELLRRESLAASTDPVATHGGAGEVSSAPPAALLDLTAALAALDLGILYPPPPVVDPITDPAADPALDRYPPAAPPPAPAPSVLQRLARHPRLAPLVRRLSGPRVLAALDHARRLPGGVNLRNLSFLFAHALLIRIPLVNRLYLGLRVLRQLPARVAALEPWLNEVTTIQRNLSQLVETQTNNALYGLALSTRRNDDHLLARLNALEHRLRVHTAAAAIPTPTQAVLSAPSPAPQLPAELYYQFEQRFRGDPALIEARLCANLGRFTLMRDAQHHPVVDLGCGRGEWLALLGRHGILARGVDSNAEMVAHCQAQGLTVEHADALAWLAAQPDRSLAGLTGFHIIEHLPFAVMLQLLADARRVVQPGGVVLFETPNPENFVVGTCNFYLDPTHLRPLPPALMAFLFEYYGFEHVSIERRHPADAAALEAATLPPPLGYHLHGALDYAVIGYAPAALPSAAATDPVTDSAPTDSASSNSAPTAIPSAAEAPCI